MPFKLERKNSIVSKKSWFTGEFMPQSVGRYRIDVLNSNVPVKNSPLFVNVFDPQCIEVISRPADLFIGSDNVIEVDLSKYYDLQCSFCNLRVKVRSPNGTRLPFKFDQQNSLYKLRIIPKEKGTHRISIKLGDQHIKST